MFTLGGEALDAQAGEPGYSPLLLRGLPTPIGARLLLWLPAIAVAILAPTVPYVFSTVWRLRSLFDYRQERTPWHIGKQGAGVADTTAPPGQQARVVIPAAHEVVVYNQPEPGGLFDGVTQVIREESVSPRRPSYDLPLLPDSSTGIYQQGVLDPAADAVLAPIPEWLQHEVAVKGDELLIGVTRATDAFATWDFAQPAGPDALFSQQFGDGGGTTYPDLGIYAMIGKTS
jgi:hypothetical protein